MPIYQYICDKCGVGFDRFNSINDRHKPCEEACSCGEVGSIRMFIGTNRNNIADPVRLGRVKLPDSWKEYIRAIKKNTPGHNIGDRFKY